MGGSGVLKLAIVTPAKWYRFWWCEVIEQLVTQRDHHECPRYRFPRPVVAADPAARGSPPEDRLGQPDADVATSITSLRLNIQRNLA